MTTPQQQILDKCKAILEIAKDKYGFHQNVQIRFDLRGRAAGMAGVRAGQNFYMRFNADMLTRDAFEHVLNNTVPHEIAHLVCFDNRALGSGHNHGWARVCAGLGGNATRCHTEKVVFGKGTTYEYITTTGKEVRLGDRHHAMIQSGVPVSYRKSSGKGQVTKACAYTIVGIRGQSLANPVAGKTPAVTPVNPIVQEARKSFTIGTAPVPAPLNPALLARFKHVNIPAAKPATMPAGTSKAAMARAIMLSGKTQGKTYEEVITAIMHATGHDRQLARATYKANAAKVGIQL